MKVKNYLFAIFCPSKKPFFAAKSSGGRKYGRNSRVDKTRFVNN
jgi:hypothetical protein